MKRRVLIPLLAALAIAGSASSARAESILDIIVGVLVDGGNSYNWEKVELPGAVCGNGSQYKFFVHRTSSPNLLFLFEGGGRAGTTTRAAAARAFSARRTPTASPTTTCSFTAKYVSPIVNGADPGMPLRSRTDLIDQELEHRLHAVLHR